ncbi:hypothetical protein [Nostoc sp.]|uniref:hypothetical protein n=1 Tax=Nostoc sp. TaxID=1180 RepID=UPI002FFBC7BD
MNEVLSLVDEPLSFVDEVLSFVDEPLSFVDEPLSFVNEPLSFVDEPLSFVNEPLSFVNESLILVNELLSFVNESLILVNKPFSFVVLFTNRLLYETLRERAASRCCVGWVEEGNPIFPGLYWVALCLTQATIFLTESYCNAPYQNTKGLEINKELGINNSCRDGINRVSTPVQTRLIESLLFTPHKSTRRLFD